MGDDGVPCAALQVVKDCHDNGLYIFSWGDVSESPQHPIALQTASPLQIGSIHSSFSGSMTSSMLLSHAAHSGCVHRERTRVHSTGCVSTQRVCKVATG